MFRSSVRELALKNNIIETIARTTVLNDMYIKDEILNRTTKKITFTKTKKPNK